MEVIGRVILVSYILNFVSLRLNKIVEFLGRF